MGRKLGGKNKVAKQFCINGHDTFICGRDIRRTCKICRKNIANKYARKIYIAHPQPLKQFCKRGHDTFICGRDENDMCNLCIPIYQQEYYEINRDKILAKNKLRQKEHRKERNARANKRYKTDPNFKLMSTLRTRLYDVLKKDFKIGSAIKDLGCSVEFLKDYISSQFHNGMSWANWGSVWELDHVEALWKFNLSNREQFLKACHYTNLQPLTIEEHKKKTKQDQKEFYQK